MKTCTKCNAEKPQTEFYIRSSGVAHAHCKDCFRKRVRARYHGPDHKTILDADKAAAKITRARGRDAAFAAYGGYKCACCAETEPKFLTLDHIGNDGAKWRREKLGSRTMAGYRTYRLLALNGYPDGFQVLCMNCNHGKRMNNGVCPHQARCNDQSKDVGASAPKHSAPALKLVAGG